MRSLGNGCGTRRCALVKSRRGTGVAQWDVRPTLQAVALRTLTMRTCGPVDAPRPEGAADQGLAVSRALSRQSSNSSSRRSSRPRCAGTPRACPDGAQSGFRLLERLGLAPIRRVSLLHRIRSRLVANLWTTGAGGKGYCAEERHPSRLHLPVAKSPEWIGRDRHCSCCRRRPGNAPPDQAPEAEHPRAYRQRHAAGTTGIPRDCREGSSGIRHRLGSVHPALPRPKGASSTEAARSARRPQPRPFAAVREPPQRRSQPDV